MMMVEGVLLFAAEDQGSEATEEDRETIQLLDTK
jgi:hypothetical protein